MSEYLPPEIRELLGLPPDPTPPPAPTPSAPDRAYCFEWGGALWGRDYPGWGDFRGWLIDHGADPDQWAANHPAAASCIGASVQRFCFEWGGRFWGRDYAGWDAFRGWLIDHGADPDQWVYNHRPAADCIGAPPPRVAAPPLPSGTEGTYPPAGEPPPPQAPTPTPAPGGGGAQAGGQAPATPSYNSGAGPFAGRGVFTSDNPLRAAELGTGITWVAVRPEFADPATIAALRDAGYKVVVWQDMATLAGARFARENADGYIAQAEGPEQLAAATAVGDVLGPMAKALVSNNFMPAYPPGWVAMPEAYTQENPLATIASVTQDALNRGAQTVIPIAGTYMGAFGSYGASRYLADAARLGLTSLGAFAIEAMSADDLDVWSVPGVPPPESYPGGGGAPGAGPSAAYPPRQRDGDGRPYCFEWDGRFWGGDYPGWGEFRAWLLAHGADPERWIQNHQPAAGCLGLLGPPVPTGPAVGGAAEGGQSFVIPGVYPTTHCTDNLPGYPAYDFMLGIGTQVRSPGIGTLYYVHYITPKPGFGGWTGYYRTNAGHWYFITHLGNMVPAGNYGNGAPLGRVGDFRAYFAPHVHVGSTAYTGRDCGRFSPPSFAGPVPPPPVAVGPSGPEAQGRPIPPLIPTDVGKPAELNKPWRRLLEVFATRVPDQRAAAVQLGKDLQRVFK